MNISAAGLFNLCEPAIANSIAATSSAAASIANLTENSSLNSAQNADEKTYAQAAATNTSYENTSILANAKRRLSSNLTRSKSKIQHFEKNKKTNSKSNSTFSYRERRLILLNSKNSNFNSMKTRDKINREFQKQLKLPASEFILAVIMKSQKQQNVVLTTMSNYNADFLIQHQNIWQKCFEFSSFLHDKA